MTKSDFLKLLKYELESNKVRSVDEILSDYEEHFNHGLSKGKSESDIAEALGSPTTIAQAYKTDHMIREIKNPEHGFRWGMAFSIILRLIILAPFNFIILFIPGILIFTFLVTGWALAGATGSIGLTILWNLPQLLSLSSTYWMGLAGISWTVGLVGLSAIGLMTMFFITKYIVMALISYLQWNLKFVMEK